MNTPHPLPPPIWSLGSPRQFSFNFCVISGLSYILSTKSRNQNKRKQTMRLYLYFLESKKAIAFLVLKTLCCCIVYGTQCVVYSVVYGTQCVIYSIVYGTQCVYKFSNGCWKLLSRPVKHNWLVTVLCSFRIVLLGLVISDSSWHSF